MELEETLKLCRQYGVTKLRLDSLFVELGKDPNEPVVIPVENIKHVIGGDLAPTEDELLYWSSDKDLPDVGAKQPE